MSVAELFTFAGRTWNIDRALICLARSPRADVEIPVADLRPLLALIRINDTHLPDVDLRRPILLAPIELADSGKRFLLPIDGWHRIARVVELGLESVRAYVLTAEEADAVRVDPARRRPRRVRS